MSKEKLDIVNEQNEIIYSEFRDIAHAQNLIHRNVHILILNEKKEIFLKKRVPHRDYPNMWESSVAGHVSSGLSGEEAAYKELHEELIIDDIVLRFLGVFKNFSSTEKQFTYIYYAYYNGAIEVDLEEAVCGDFFPFEQCFSKDLTENTIFCLEKIKELVL